MLNAAAPKGVCASRTHPYSPRMRKYLNQQIKPFSGKFSADLDRHPGDVATRPGEARGIAQANRIAGERNDRDHSRQLCDGARRDAKRRDQVRPRCDRRRGELGQPSIAAVGVAVIDDQVVTPFVSEIAQTGLVTLKALPGAAHRPEPKKDDVRHPALRIGKPSNAKNRARQRCGEITTLHSMT